MAEHDLSRLSLDEIARLAGAQKRRPVEKWNPQRCGDSFMRIGRDGSWHHEGRPIARPALVRLFSSILRREPDGSFVLVTPAEKLSIEVEDAPFVAVEVRSEGAGAERSLAFRLNTDELVLAGPDHPLWLEGERPYLNVRPGLDALIARPVYYELAEMALEEGGIWSGGAYFPLGRAT
ncbi:MAG: DUF1285 domain-containing protein [Pseudomonadota bacterium]|nr:DUF1285 domain-containing protein [Pseudomonadota bacterium]